MNDPHAVAYAAKIFGHALATAALNNQLGPTGDTNVQGEATKKLDVFANVTIREASARNALVAATASNLQSGRDLVAAGYVMYGPSTMFVHTVGDSVDGFTLDRDIGEFVLTHPRVQCPERGKYYSANLGRSAEWPSEFQTFTNALAGTVGAHSLRYSGALVADVHRNLVEGGVYLYPPDREHPEGKLRLLYECAPLAFVVEQAGGAASTGVSRVLDVPITSIHQRVPFIIGSRLDVFPITSQT